MEINSISQSLDRLKESFLLAAAQGGNEQDCESLLEIGADVNWKSSEGETPLLISCKRGHTGVMQILISHGADVNCLGKDIQTPLHICARRGDVEGLMLLLGAGCNTTKRNKDGYTAFDLAKIKGHQDICDMITSYQKDGQLARILPPLQVSQSISNLNKKDDKEAKHTEISVTPSATSPRLQSESKVSEGYELIGPSVRSLSSSSYSNNSSSKSNQYGKTNIAVDSTKSFDENYLEDSSNESAGQYQRLYLQEQKQRKLVEGNYNAICEQIRNINVELLTVRNDLSNTLDKNRQLQEELDIMNAEERILSSFDIDDCARLEKRIKSVLERVERRKDDIINQKLQKDTRLCVVCQSKEKTVLLLPCRHLCLCDECVGNLQIQICPLCRKRIDEKISVFS